MKTFDRIILYITVIVLSILCCYTIYKSTQVNDIVYADIGKVTQEYLFKRDLEKLSGEKLYHLKAIIDSLEMVKKLSGRDDRVDEQLVQTKHVFEDYYAASNADISKKIWDRLNPVIAQYGREKKIKILLGANGAGSLLYADTGRDITGDLINYINRKYEKGY